MAPNVRQDNDSIVTTPATLAIGLDAGETAERKTLLRKPSRKHTLLFVDDERHVVRALRRAFADEGYRILTAENGEQAMVTMAENGVDLVISDYQMPGLLGTELLRKIREKYPQTIRIMLTGAADTRAVMDAINNGAVYKFITKPWNDDDLKVTVRLALAQSELIKENVQLKKVTRSQLSEISKLKRLVEADRSTLGNVLVAKGTILPGQLEMVEKYCRQKNIILVKAFIELGMVEEQVLIKIIQDESKADLILLDESMLQRDLSSLLPREVCQAGCLIPVSMEDKTLVLAMADPLDLSRIDYISFTTWTNVVTRLARLTEIEKAIEYIYSVSGEESQPVVQDFDRSESEEEIDVLLDNEELETAEQLMAKSSAPSAVQTVNSIIAEAIRTGSSDIHIEPKTGCTLVRYRIDGLLQEPLTIPAKQHLATISRLKILAKMDIAERRIPQDGRITVRSRDKLVDIRVSSMPTINGEKIVCRLLDKTASVRSLDDIGITGKTLERLRNIISIPQGMIIATGPTGSGKTTSLYSLMTERLSSSLNFVTIEDPVEYYLEKASQVHVRQKIGLTFASSLRCTLRQDPDVILVGEIRDIETALAAFQAAMTGHLVFTSLHTNSTIATISRLFHLGVEPYLVASAIQGIIAQRLVRKLCPECKEKREFDKDLPRVLGVANNDFPDQLYYGRGCEKCSNSGFLGRTGLFEVFQMNDEFRQFLTANYQESQLLNMARSLGMETILENGIKKVLNGQTTLEELLRVLGPASVYDYHCKNCGRDLDVKFSTCPYCGTPQRLICQNCHARLEPDWVACPYCGQK